MGKNTAKGEVAGASSTVAEKVVGGPSVPRSATAIGEVADISGLTFKRGTESNPLIIALLDKLPKLEAGQALILTPPQGTSPDQLTSYLHRVFTARRKRGVTQMKISCKALEGGKLAVAENRG